LRKINKSPNRGKNLDVHFFFQFLCHIHCWKAGRTSSCGHLLFWKWKKKPITKHMRALEVHFFSIFIPHTHFQKVGKAICGQAILKVYKTKSVTKHRKGPWCSLFLYILTPHTHFQKVGRTICDEGAFNDDPKPLNPNNDQDVWGENV
jgi:hypothetical protein